jgi:signal transduction histidine kinase
MVKKSGYIWIISLFLLVLIVDAYFQIQSSAVPIWQTGWFFWRVIALVAILCCVIIFNYFELNRRKKAQFEEFKRKVMESQEKEWREIAGELHDNIGQNLSAANIFLQKSLNSDSIIRENIENASALIIETVDEIRRISQKFYPKQIERLGITVSVQAMIERLGSASGIKFTTSIESIDGMLTKENEVQLFRIIQEILNNIVKHSMAKNVKH